MGGLGASLLMLQICTMSQVQWDVDVRGPVRHVTQLNERSFVSLVKFSTVGDDNLGFRSATFCALLLYRLDNINALHNFAEHHVLPVQPGEQRDRLVCGTNV